MQVGTATVNMLFIFVLKISKVVKLVVHTSLFCIFYKRRVLLFLPKSPLQSRSQVCHDWASTKEVFEYPGQEGEHLNILSHPDVMKKIVEYLTSGSIGNMT